MKKHKILGINKSTLTGIFFIIEKLVWGICVMIPIIYLTCFIENNIESTKNLIIILAIVWFLYYHFAVDIWKALLMDWEKTIMITYKCHKHNEKIALLNEINET